MSLTSKAAIRFAAALDVLAAGAGCSDSVNVLVAGASVALVLADNGLGGIDHQNVLVATLTGLARARRRIDAGGIVVLDAQSIAPLRETVQIIEMQRGMAWPDEIQNAHDVVLCRVLKLRKTA